LIDVQLIEGNCSPTTDIVPVQPCRNVISADALTDRVATIW